ncbi:magnesium-transporting ATPase [Hydrococcus rivularis NIES-593]|uniref:Magnesium-transporting ATPase n=1 Tax=Hydrococcus rivularis NIES-593 TaxID=1921803 RepID=A0A1U7HFG1_9CYAN|nr:cation-translocating P-type ATPase [Hydrococcus rivularis]OKH22316.1 magnesium-transporting ATPase [Hydrococcus rivularis NIES-593]
MTTSYSSHCLPAQQQSWHTYPVEKTLEILGSDAQQGLTTDEVEQRLKHYGINEIQETAGRSNWEILLDQFKNIMLLMLIAVAIVSGILDVVELQNAAAPKEGVPFKDTIAILLIVILNGVLGYLQESRAEKALAALKRLSSPKVQVIRDGHRIEVDAPTLVPGDIMLLEAGAQLCADGQVIEASNLQVRESALTGEAQAVHKHKINPGLAEDTPLGDRRNMVFTGTEVIQGRAKVIVTRTGMATELGKIAQMLQLVETEATPLQQRMGQLGNVLVSGSLMLVALVIAIGVIQAGWGQLQKLVEVSLSMAVAVVPEGLPAVITVTLALGTQRMVRRNALIRKLPAVETLGSVNVICSDKTGTLTQNKMVVREVEILGSGFQVTGEGYAPIGEFLDTDGRAIAIENYPELQVLLMACALCNDAQLTQQGQEEWKIVGDPTEGALLALAGKAGFQQQALSHHFKRVEEIPFSSERKRMSVICWSGNWAIGDRLAESLSLKAVSYLMFTKGSPELVLDHCQFYQLGDRILSLTHEQRQQILQMNNDMAGRGLRVLGFAYKPLEAIPEVDSAETIEQNLIWLGLVGMLDAPRPEVKEAVAKCREAGIRTIMITGDHQLTAQAIGKQLGIIQEGDRILTGRELEKLSQSQLEEEVDRVRIYARVAPEHKLRIVQALQKRGKFVAMTGDGVNDAPALKQADIGIAMGITGTDVSKEASDMVLLDDNFATIVAATEEGRVVYNNIRLFVKYILGSNIGEVITIAAAPLLGVPDVPLTPLQILWMNLVTDGLPALALAVEPADPNIMRRLPFSPKESIFARGLGSYIIRIGLIFSIISISLMIWSFTQARQVGNPDSWKTMVFTTLCLAQMGHAIAVRSSTRLTIEMNPLSNPYLLAAVAITTIFQLMLIYVEPLRRFFGTQFLTMEQLLICIGFSTLMFVWVELEKLLIRWFLSRKRAS